MLLRTFIPRPPLSDFVDSLWLFDRHGPAPPRARDRRMPSGNISLIINLSEDETRVYDRERVDRCQTLTGAVLCGMHSQFFVIDTDEQTSVMGVEFRPGGAGPFFHAPSSEFRDLHVSLDDLWGRRAGELRERVLTAPTPAMKFAAIESILLEAVVRPLQRHPAIGYALEAFSASPATPTITDVTRLTGLTPKRFIQRFSEDVGLTPKLFCRLRRFERLLQVVHSSRQVDWADLAGGAGYFDQAHFIRDFRAFSGLTPGEYLALRGPFANHVPLGD